MRLRTAFGGVTLAVWRGNNPIDGRWGIPIRQRWGLGPHQQLSPALEDKVAYFATMTGTYEMAAQLAGKLGISIEDSTVRQLVQRLGARAEAQTQQRLKTVPSVIPGPPSALAVIMMDGYQVRHRGPDWGEAKSAQTPRGMARTEGGRLLSSGAKRRRRATEKSQPGLAGVESPRLADRQWSGRIGLRPATATLQTSGPVLD